MRILSQRCSASGYALLIVMGITAVTLMILAATMSRTANVAFLNERNNQYVLNVNAAEAATEKAYALMAYDFQSYGPGQVQSRLDVYRQNVPSTAESGSAYWSDFEFSNGQGVTNRTYVALTTNEYTGPLPSQYEGLLAIKSPIYRIVSNVRSRKGNTYMTNAVQEDVLLALVPITTYAIFYNTLLEFSTCATMIINGRVHANSNIYVGAGGSPNKLTFNSDVTASGTVTAPYNNDSSWTGPTVYNSSNWRTTFNAPGYFAEHAPTVTLSINMTNTRSMIEMPAPGVGPTNQTERNRLFNTAHMILLVSNSTVTLKLQKAPSQSEIPADDGSFVLTNYTYALARTNLPFLSLTNRFYDQREDKTNIVTQIDIGQYGAWALTNTVVQGKFDKNSDQYPTILYVADNRTNTSKQLPSVRLVNGLRIPTNGPGYGRGFSVATPNPLYIKGDYNCASASELGTTNTTSVKPAALMSDALTILSSAWNDNGSFTLNQDGPNASSATTINAAILTGVVSSTSTNKSGFSGGVHNLPRMLEDWGSSTLWLNTSIVNLYTSAKATNKFVTPGTGSYYIPPTRQFSFDRNFLDPNRQPPGVPCALVPIRYNWAVPPANTVTYNVTP